MNNSNTLRSLVVYAICVPLALFVGYRLTDPMTYGTFGVVGLLALVMAFPLLMRWHQPLLLLSWNMAAIVFFFPGQPKLWLLMVVISLGVSILHRAMSREAGFISVPQLTLPLVFLTAVVLITAKLNGGIGLRLFGSDVYGGKRYIYLLGAIAGYFAFCAQRIPKERASFYAGLFFIGGVTYMIGDLVLLGSPSLHYIFLVFPPSTVEAGAMELGTTRLTGMQGASAALVCFMLARYGIRGILQMRRPWRLVAFLGFAALGLLSGFRSLVILYLLIIAIQFYLEGLHHTRLLPLLLSVIVLAGAIVVPLANKLPFTFQRALAFLPVSIDPAAKYDAQASLDWRVRMWKAVLPQVPEHLWLGKGYALRVEDFDMLTGAGRMLPTFAGFEENWLSALSGNYHNGPLSLLLPFGIWGAIGFVWFIIVSMRVTIANFRYCPAEMRMLNSVVLSIFLARVLMFFFIYGSFGDEMYSFTGLVGLSVSLNGGVCRRTVEQPVELEPEESGGFSAVLGGRRPAFLR